MDNDIYDYLKYLYNHKFNIKDKTEMFIECCKNGDMTTLQWLYSLGEIDIHAHNEGAFICSCGCGYLEVAKWLFQLGGIDIHAQNENAFISSCANGYLEVAQWLFSLGGIDIHAQNEHAFVWSCGDDHLEVAKWLYGLGGIDIYAQNENAFVWSCECGYLEIAKWLFSLGGIDIHAQNESAFVWSCRNGHLEVAKWLCSICDAYRLEEGKGLIYLVSTNPSSHISEDGFAPPSCKSDDAFGENVEGNLEENIMNNKITLDEDILKFGMFYGKENVVIKCLDNKVMLPMGSLKCLFIKEKSNTNKHEIWVKCEDIPEMNDNKESIVKILYNYGYTLNDDDKEVLKTHGIDSANFV